MYTIGQTIRIAWLNLRVTGKDSGGYFLQSQDGSRYRLDILKRLERIG